MKKQSIFITISVIFLLLSSAFVIDNNSVVSEVHLESSKKYTEINEMALDSDLVIRGTVIKVESHGNAEEKYTLSVSDSYVSNFNYETIEVYEFAGTLEKGNEYLLFLESYDSMFSDTLIYTSIDKENIIDLDDIKINNNGKILEKDLKSVIKTLTKIEKKQAQLTKKLTKFTDDAEAVELSEVIIECTIENELHNNANISIYEVNVNKTYKGDSSQLEQLVLPANLKVGDDYLILLNTVDGSFEISSRENSIIKLSDSQKINSIRSKLK